MLERKDGIIQMNERETERERTLCTNKRKVFNRLFSDKGRELRCRSEYHGIHIGYMATHDNGRFLLGSWIAYHLYSIESSKE